MSEIKYRPVDLRCHEVNGILRRGQTQIRRAVNFERASIRGERISCGTDGYSTVTPTSIEKVPWTQERLGHLDCPHGKPGDRLWVREGWWKIPEPSVRELRAGADTWPKVAYTADEPIAIYEEYKEWGWKAKSPIHMPRWASRLTLELTEVRVQRLQEISKEDCIAEGMTALEDVHAGWHQSYAQLWESIHGPGSWAANDWVFAETFKVVQPEERV